MEVNYTKTYKNNKKCKLGCVGGCHYFTYYWCRIDSLEQNANIIYNIIRYTVRGYHYCVRGYTYSVGEESIL